MDTFQFNLLKIPFHFKLVKLPFRFNLMTSIVFSDSIELSESNMAISIWTVPAVQ